MLTKHKMLSLCLLLVVRPGLFGMESDDKPTGTNPLAIVGVVAAGAGTIGALWGLWRWTHPAISDGIDENLMARIREIQTTDDANKLWEETYQAYNQSQDPRSHATAVRLFDALYNYCRSTQGLKTDEDLATWQSHLESFKSAL